MMSVLVIDDDAGVRDSIARVLVYYGIDVRTAVDGVAGVEEFLRQPADIVIVDIIMPRLSGVEVIKKIRGDYRRARIIASPVADSSDRRTTSPERSCFRSGGRSLPAILAPRISRPKLHGGKRAGPSERLNSVAYTDP
jgi:CheY-like chemotaxis protein